MKYYSEVTEKVYDNLEALEAAEKKVADEKAKKDLAIANASKEKKELANAIETADKELDQAYAELDLAREKARQLQKEHTKKLEEILYPAEEEVRKAQSKKYEAISNFNKKYGVFTTTYTGTKAAEEMNRAIKYFDDVFGKIFF